MIHKNLERWCTTMLDNGTHYNEDYEQGINSLIEIASDLLEHKGCHNNPLWDCACDAEITAAEFTYEVLDRVMAVGGVKQTIMTHILVDYLSYMDNKSDELFDIQQDTQRRLERLQDIMRDVYQEAERQGYSELVDLITTTKPEEE